MLENIEEKKENDFFVLFGGRVMKSGMNMKKNSMTICVLFVWTIWTKKKIKYVEQLSVPISSTENVWMSMWKGSVRL